MPRYVSGPPADLDPGTLVDLYYHGLRAHPGQREFRVRRPDGTWESVSRPEAAERIAALATGLKGLGYERGDRIGIICHTRLEWALADWAMILAGLVSVPVYPSLPPEQVLHVLGDAGARAVFVEDPEQAAKVREVAGDLDGLDRMVMVEGEPEPVDGVEILPLSDVVRRGEESDGGGNLEAYARRTEPDDLATLIYTSGTTGRPKGVMLSHHNLYSNAVLSTRVFPLQADDLALAWLPLSHVFERAAGHYMMWYRGVSVAFAESVDTVARDISEVRPTVMTGIPRLYEKLQARTARAAREAGGLTEMIFRWASRVGKRRVEREQAGGRAGPWLRLQHAVADRLVFSRLRERLGGRLRLMVSGGAPLSTEVAAFLHGAGLPVLEGYGLTETSPVLTINPPDRPRLGTVGPPIPGTELSIADDGEILARGPQVMQGYYGQEEATREALDEDGWLRTGDVGELDEEGYLRITDRKKEIIVTSGGKNLAPQPVEKAIERSPLVEHAVLIGDRRRFVMVVLVPEPEAARSWCEEKGIGLTGGDREELADVPELRERLERVVERRTREFADYERPKKVLVVAGPFTVENGILTPTQKVKRREVEDRYRAAIDEIYRTAKDPEEDAA